MNRNTLWIEWERMGREVERAQAQSVQICIDHKLKKCYKNDSKSMITNAVLQGLRKSSLTLYHSSHQGSSCDPMTVAQLTLLASSPACALARLPRVWSWQKLSGPHPWLVRPNVLDEEWKDQGVLKFYVAKCPKWLFSTRAAKRNANQTVSADKKLEKTLPKHV